MKTFETITSGAALGAMLLTTMTAPTRALAHPGHSHGGQNVQRTTVVVDGSGYHPATVGVKAGQQVHLTFVSKGASCANGISIPALKKTLSLKPGQKKEIVFTPKQGQTIAFACSMKMFKGKVTAK